MTYFVLLDVAQEGQLWLNPNAIESFRPSGEGVVIRSVSGREHQIVGKNAREIADEFKKATGSRLLTFGL
jgi:hypothetical protein